MYFDSQKICQGKIIILFSNLALLTKLDFFFIFFSYLNIFSHIKKIL
jgi:hypothetical protein